MRGSLDVALTLFPTWAVFLFFTMGPAGAADIPSLETQAEGGSSEAQYQLARLYLNGWGVEVDYEKALYWGRRSAKQNNPKGETLLGYLFENGRAVEIDLGKAAALYQKAAASGYSKAVQLLAGLAVKLKPAAGVVRFRQSQSHMVAKSVNYREPSVFLQSIMEQKDFSVEKKDLNTGKPNTGEGKITSNPANSVPVINSATQNVATRPVAGGKQMKPEFPPEGTEGLACEGRGKMLNRMGWKYLQAIGRKRNIALAVDCFELAVEEGCPAAKENITHMDELIQ